MAVSAATSSRAARSRPRAPVIPGGPGPVPRWSRPASASAPLPRRPGPTSLRRVVGPLPGAGPGGRPAGAASSARRTLGVQSRTALIRCRPAGASRCRWISVGRPARLRRQGLPRPPEGAAVAEGRPPSRSTPTRCATLRVPPTVAHLPAGPPDGAAGRDRVPLEALLGRPLSSAGGPSSRPRPSFAQPGRSPTCTGCPCPPGGRGRGTRRWSGSRAARWASPVSTRGRATRSRGSRSELRVTQRELPGAVTGVVHGDCKPSQVLLDHQQVLLMDLDHVAVADQAMDVGTFLASLRRARCADRARFPSRPGARRPAERVPGVVPAGPGGRQHAAPDRLAGGGGAGAQGPACVGARAGQPVGTRTGEGGGGMPGQAGRQAVNRAAPASGPTARPSGTCVVRCASSDSSPAAGSPT